jgi:hypothetical protein
MASKNLSSSAGRLSCLNTNIARSHATCIRIGKLPLSGAHQILAVRSEVSQLVLCHKRKVSALIGVEADLFPWEKTYPRLTTDLYKRIDSDRALGVSGKVSCHKQRVAFVQKDSLQWDKG